ncbi:MAG TPA: hypothetical protein VFI70_04600, partial [Nitrososphaeraceae archaeon]|nr:hypothetical protein [Nitrososphaeraceae archaeon]
LILQAVYRSLVGLLIHPDLINQIFSTICTPTYHLDLWNSFSAALAASSLSILMRLTSTSLSHTSTSSFSVL